MGVTRLEFIKGALVSLGFGAFGGRRLFAAPLGWKHGGTPNLVFGVLSDTHLRTGVKSENLGANWPDKYFVAALRYFKECNVDAVVLWTYPDPARRDFAEFSIRAAEHRRRMIANHINCAPLK
jgi:hypothetical protein